jgi:hypothetical protein
MAGRDAAEGQSSDESLAICTSFCLRSVGSAVKTAKAGRCQPLIAALILPCE